MRRGQSSIEYATIVAIVSAALISMAIYMKRSVSGKLREGADSVGEQYHPTQTSGTHTLRANSTVVTTSTLKRDQDVNGEKADVMEYTTVIPADRPETTKRNGNEDVGPIGNDVWN